MGQAVHRAVEANRDRSVLERVAIANPEIAETVAVDGLDDGGPVLFARPHVFSTGHDVWHHLRARLTAEQMPAAVAVVARIPRLPDGGVDTARSAAIISDEQAVYRFVEPATEVERHLVRLWTEVLGHDRISVLDDFFDLGGESAHAVLVADRVRAELGVDLTMQDLFGAGTPRGLAALVDQQGTSR